MKTQLAALLIAVLAISIPASAGTRERVYAKPCKVVFAIAEKLGGEKPYRLQLDGKADMNLIIGTGSFWKWGEATIIVRFTDAGNDSCTVADNSPYSGVRRNGTVFLDRLQAALGQLPAPDHDDTNWWKPTSPQK